MNTSLDSDRAITSSELDEFGFSGIAKSLAPRIIEASYGDGLVIGLEGSWGSGKSSLMGLLRQEIQKTDELEPNNIHTITVAPWVDGDGASLVLSMLNPISLILKDSIETSTTDDLKAKAKDLSDLVAIYAGKTARWLSPLTGVANLASYILPEAKIAEKILGSFTKIISKPSKKEPPTTSALKELISENLKELDHRFIIFLDDLDRLEPKQAVEVVRLVRSVADFPKVVYVMCYDREVLANGLKVGLNVEDGDLFLQKIVQLTFQIPRFELFDLRQKFLRDVQSIYLDVNGLPLNDELLDELKEVVDSAGGNLSTPREVKLILNAIRFSYPSIFNDIHFPDLCWLYLIKTTRHKLYRWVEEYLLIRSTIATGHGRITDDGKAELGKRLNELLPSDDYSSTDSISNFSTRIPGISMMPRALDSQGPEEQIFCATNQYTESKAVSNKRIASPIHYRYYFALTGTKDVMQDNEFTSIVYLSENDPRALLSHLIERSEEQGMTKLKQLIFRLERESSLSIKAMEGMIRSIIDMMDLLLKNQDKVGSFKATIDQKFLKLICDFLKKIGETDNSRKNTIALWIAQDGLSINWIVGEFFRRQLYDHRLLRTKQKEESELIFSEPELDKLLNTVKTRIAAEDVKTLIGSIPKLNIYLYGWKDILGNDSSEVNNWVSKFCEDEVNFLHLLKELRQEAYSDRLYYILSKKNVSDFLDWDEVIKRLETLRQGKYAQQVSDIFTAIELNSRWE